MPGRALLEKPRNRPFRLSKQAPAPVQTRSGLPVPPVVLWIGMFALLGALATVSTLRRRRAAERAAGDAGEQ